MSLADFQEVSHLGEGAYSSVYKVIRKSDGKDYALKKVKLPNLSDKEKQNALNEVRLLASVKHQNIVAYKEAFLDENSHTLCIVTEYADGGDLYQKIVEHQKSRTYFKESDIWRILIGCAQGLKALHDLKILHRDMKSANVFLTRGGDVKIGDFNVSKVAKRGMLYTQTGTPYYASPEVWKDMPYDAKSDVWSLGVILYEMCALKPPFRADDMEALYRKVLRGEYSCIPAAFSSDLECLVALLLQVNPVTRPSMGQLLQHPVMQAKISQLQSLSPALSLHSNNPNFEEIPPGDLLNTIKLPPNVGSLTQCLPKPNYDDGETTHAPSVRMSTKSSRITKNTRGGYTHTHNHAPSVHSAAETSLAVSLESVPPPPPPQPSHHEPAKSSVAGRGSPSADREGAGRENGKEKEREKESSQEQSKSDSSSKDREGKEGVGTSSSAARASSLPPRAPPSSSAPVRQRSESRAPPSDGGGNGSPPTRGDSSLPVGSRGKSSDKGRNSNSISNASGGGHGREAQRPSLGSPSSSHEKKDRGRVSPSSSHPSVPSSSDPARSREKEREKERERVKEKENEREREAAEQLERFRQRAREKEREREREKELSREREREKERERIRDREREEASWREKEKERAERRERRRERKREKDLQRDLDAGIIHAFNSGSNHGRGLLLDARGGEGARLIPRSEAARSSDHSDALPNLNVRRESPQPPPSNSLTPPIPLATPVQPSRPKDHQARDREKDRRRREREREREKPTGYFDNCFVPRYSPLAGRGNKEASSPSHQRSSNHNHNHPAAVSHVTKPKQTAPLSLPPALPLHLHGHHGHSHASQHSSVPKHHRDHRDRDHQGSVLHQARGGFGGMDAASRAHGAAYDAFCMYRQMERERDRHRERDRSEGLIARIRQGANDAAKKGHGVQMPLLPSISPLNLQAGGKAGGRTPPPAAASSVLPPVGSPPVISGGMPIDAERSRSRRRAGGGHAKDRGDKGGDRGGRGFINNHHQHPLSHHHQELPKLPCLPQIHRHDRDRGHHGGGDDDRGGGRERDRGRDREGGRRERDRDRDGTTRLPSLVCR